MNAKPPETQTPGQRAWGTIRFLLFGVSGLIVMLVFSFALVFRVVEKDPQFASPWISLPLACAGMLMLLFGVGEWRRPAYLWVFVSFPASLALLTACRRSIPEMVNGKSAPVVFAGLVAAVIYFVVEFYYSDQNERERSRTDA